METQSDYATLDVTQLRTAGEEVIARQPRAESRSDMRGLLNTLTRRAEGAQPLEGDRWTNVASREDVRSALDNMSVTENRHEIEPIFDALVDKAQSQR